MPRKSRQGPQKGVTEKTDEIGQTTDERKPMNADGEPEVLEAVELEPGDPVQPATKSEPLATVLAQRDHLLLALGDISYCLRRGQIPAALGVITTTLARVKADASSVLDAREK
jgi:hypothetical protein